MARHIGHTHQIPYFQNGSSIQHNIHRFSIDISERWLCVMLLLIRSLAPINRHHHSFALFNFYGKSFCIVHYNSMAFFKCALGRCYYVCTEAALAITGSTRIAHQRRMYDISGAPSTSAALSRNRTLFVLCKICKRIWNDFSFSAMTTTSGHHDITTSRHSRIDKIEAPRTKSTQRMTSSQPTHFACIDGIHPSTISAYATQPSSSCVLPYLLLLRRLNK